MTAQLPAHLSETINNLGAAAKALEEEVRIDRAARDTELAAERAARDALLLAEAAQRRREARRLNALLAAIAVLILVVAGLSIYSRYVGNQSRQVIDTIESCTNVDGDCARISRERTGAAIDQLVTILVEIESCGRDPQASDAEYRRCVHAAMVRTVGPSASPSPSPSHR